MSTVGAVNSSYSTNPSNVQLEALEYRLDEAKAQQGAIGSCWNGLKEVTNLGLSESDCESKLEEFKNGEVTFEEAIQCIEDFEHKQKNATSLISNIVTGVGAIGAAVATAATGGTTAVALGTAMAVGAPVGAAVKTAVNIFDRATNDVEGDALDVKQMTKDAISGATTGATSALSSGVGAGIKAGKVGLSIVNGVKCGAACGAVSGAVGYTADTLLEGKEFKFGELTMNTAASSFVSGTVGAVVGGGMYGLASIQGNVGQEVARSTTQAIVADSTSSSARKILGQVERDIAAA